jgi:error-prone DNA polymerase
MQELWQRTGLSRRTLEKLAKADAFQSMGLGRREALWAVRGLRDDRLPLFQGSADQMEIQREASVSLPGMALGEHIVDDYNSLRLSLRCHPLKLLRHSLAARKIVSNDRLDQIQPGRRIAIAGLALVRQRPGSANGVVFITTEDEFGIANIIVWPNVFERYRREVMTARLLSAEGKLQREGLVIHLVAEKLIDLSPLLDTIGREEFDHSARDLVVLPHPRGDEVSHPNAEVDPRSKRRATHVHPRDVRIPIKSHDFHCRGALLRLQRRVHRRGAWENDAAPVADIDLAVALGENRRQGTRPRRRQPQPQQVAALVRVGPILEAGAIVQQSVVVHELQVARLELHMHVELGIVGQRIEHVERLDMRGR